MSLLNISSVDNPFPFIAVVKNVNAENESLERFGEKGDWLTVIDGRDGEDMGYFDNHDHFSVNYVKNQFVYCSVSVAREYKNSIILEYAWTNEKYETIRTDKVKSKKGLAISPGVYWMSEISPLHFQ